MKHRFFMCFLLAICASTITFAQEPISPEKRTGKPLFTHLPSKSRCNKAELEKIAHSGKSQIISIKLNEGLELSGEILDNLTTSSGVQNINMRVSNFGNALFHVSIVTRPDKTKKITGRIIHPKYDDALTIAEENGRYYITKHKMEYFMVE